MIVNLLTFFYLACFAVCGWPSVYRMWQRKSSGDLSIAREVLLLLGVTAQFSVMVLTGAVTQVWLSPINTFVSVSITLAMIVRYR